MAPCVALSTFGWLSFVCCSCALVFAPWRPQQTFTSTERDRDSAVSFTWHTHTHRHTRDIEMNFSTLAFSGSLPSSNLSALALTFPHLGVWEKTESVDTVVHHPAASDYKSNVPEKIFLGGSEKKPKRIESVRCDWVALNENDQHSVQSQWLSKATRIKREPCYLRGRRHSVDVRGGEKRAENYQSTSGYTGQITQTKNSFFLCVRVCAAALLVGLWHFFSGSLADGEAEGTGIYLAEVPRWKVSS